MEAAGTIFILWLEASQVGQGTFPETFMDGRGCIITAGGGVTFKDQGSQNQDWLSHVTDFILSYRGNKCSPWPFEKTVLASRRRIYALQLIESARSLSFPTPTTVKHPDTWWHFQFVQIDGHILNKETHHCSPNCAHRTCT